MKSYIAKNNEVEQKWFVINAEGKTVGRLATQVATLLRGKGKPQYTPHSDNGDFVIVLTPTRLTLQVKSGHRRHITGIHLI